MKKIISLILCAFFLAGCFHAPNVPRQTYLFDLSAPSSIKHHFAEHSIYIAQTMILPQFAGTSFVYRTQNNIYTTDYYNGFFISPSEQIHQAIVNYFLKKSSLSVFEGDAIGNINYILRTKILALYADYQNPDQPMAVMSIEFSLYDLTGKSPVLTYKKIVTEKTPLQEKDSDSLITAWNIDLSKILNHLTLES